jgi:hypothetical protein
MLLKLSGARWLMYVIPAAQEAEIWRIMVPGQAGKKTENMSERKPKTKRARTMAEVIECLPSKFKTELKP